MNEVSSVREPDAAEPVEADRVRLLAEELTVGKRLVETGHVRVRTIVEEEPVVLRDEARRQSVEIERAPIGRVVDQAPAVREEGDVIVIPIVEERLVVVKQLFLVEEVRIRRASITEPVEIAATRRVMRAGIDRTPIQSPTPEEDR